MAELVRQGRESPRARLVALKLVAGLAQKDYLGEARRVHKFVRDHMRYVKDIRGVETLHTVDRLLTQMQGDCDDKTVLFCALAESIGHPTKLVAIGTTPGRYHHVYPEILINGRWLAAETTEPWELGRAPTGIAERMEKEV